MEQYYEEVKERLYDLNYTEVKDFFWLNRTPIEPQVKNGIYQDDFGNVLNIRCEASKLKVVLTGKNNHLDIDSSVCIKENMTVRLAGGSDVSIKNSSVYGLSDINVTDRSCLIIKEKSMLRTCTLSVRQKSALTITNMLLKGSLEVWANSVCKISDSEMDGICKVNNYSALSMEQVHSKAKNITVYRKGSLQVKKTKLAKKAELFIGDAAQARIFSSEIRKATMLVARIRSDLRMENVLFEKASRMIFGDSKAFFLGCRIGKSSDIRAWSHSEILAEQSVFEPKAVILAKEDTKISIYSMEAKEGMSVLGHFNSQIYIGRNCKVNKNLYILVNHGSCLTVGEDCAFAQDVTILSGDSHPVFQIDHPQVYEANSRVEISNHVWLGKSSIVLSNAVIGESSIVAPNSIAGKKYPNNCLLMGYPAKIVRQNITYDLDECDPDEISDRRYWKHTDLEK